MRISIFFKTFFTLLISFSLLFFFGLLFFYNQFSPRYVQNNIDAVKSAVLESAQSILEGQSLEDSSLGDYSSETTFIRIQNNVVTERIGPEALTDAEIIDLVIGIYDSPDQVREGNLTYFIEKVDDVYQVSYLYMFDLTDIMLIRTRIQSLRNIDMVLSELGMESAIYLFVTIAVVSILISLNLASPIRRINAYAKKVSSLDFNARLRLKRKDEFAELVSSLNEMTFNLQKSYTSLSEANLRLIDDIDFEKNQEEKKKALIMTINHELKTPVAVIKGMVEGMIDNVGRYKNRDKYLKEILIQLDSIDAITKDLTYSLKLEDLAKREDQCDTTVLLDHFKALKEYAAQAHVKLDYEILPDKIGMNPELYVILASNLIKNAINYTENKHVSVHTEIGGDKYIFIVRNGGEIPKADLERIFEPYYRINQIVGSDQGTGLGLFIVKQICQIYGCVYKIFNDNDSVVAKIEIQRII